MESMRVYSKANVKARFMKNIKEKDGHWFWIGSMDGHGYGKMMIRRRIHTASRVALYLFKDFDLDSSDDSCHMCEYRRCVNPDHLMPGSRSFNIGQSVMQGTHVSGFSSKFRKKAVTIKDAT